MDGILYSDAPNGFVHFIVLTIVLGGAAAVASGKAIAAGWKSFLILPFYMLILSAFVRFLHYALFKEDLLSWPGFVVALVVTLLGAAYGYRSRRAFQMGMQYSWLYARSGPLGWAAKIRS